MHRRRHESLPPRPVRSGKLMVIIGLLLTATVALAARLGRADPPADAPAVQAAEVGTRDLVDERLRLHLRALSR